MHCLDCPHCATGTKVIVFIWVHGNKEPILLGRYSSCTCRLSETDKQRLFKAASLEAGTV